MAASTVQIAYTAPGGSPLDITTDVLYSDAYFESQLAAIAGSFEITVRDPHQTRSFVTGGQITLTIDGTRYFGGFVTQVNRTLFFPVVDTVHTAPAAVDSRAWKLSGVDYNVLLDKRVFRKTTDYLHSIAIPVPVYDGDLIRNEFPTYFDLDGLDVTTLVQNVNHFTVPAAGIIFQQGQTLRQTLDFLVITSSVTTYATVYYVDAAKRLVWLAIQDTVAPFGFSDSPATAGAGYIGFRDGSTTEDAGSIANDVFVWGGSPFTLSGGGVVVGHASNGTSITNHGRWQLAETQFGQLASQAQVDARANALVSGGTSGTSPVTGAQGLVNPDLRFTLTWFGTDVPVVAGVPQHLTPGFVTTLRLYTFGGPFEYSLPARQIRVTFPIIHDDNTAEVQFEGTFGISISDPVWLWEYLRKFKPRNAVLTALISPADNSSVNPPSGSKYQGAPSPATDGTTTVFTIPFAYRSGTSLVFVNGLLETLTTSYTESDPANGQYTFTFAPKTTDKLFIETDLA